MIRPIRIARPAPHPFRQKVEIRALHRLAAKTVAEEHDLKLFAVAYTAFFICFYTFIF